MESSAPSSFHFAAAFVEGPLGVAVGLGGAFEDEVFGGLERGAFFEVGSHGAVGGVGGVLLVDDGGHAVERFQHLLAGAETVAEPVGDVLAGDAERGAVFHEADIVDVGDFRATDALVDPADDIAEDALGVVVEFLLDLGGVGFSRQEG